MNILSYILKILIVNTFLMLPVKKLNLSLKIIPIRLLFSFLKVVLVFKIILIGIIPQDNLMSRENVRNNLKKYLIYY
jgi:membrane protein YdbS with pleckstrin-like domain